MPAGRFGVANQNAGAMARTFERRIHLIFAGGEGLFYR